MIFFISERKKYFLEKVFIIEENNPLTMDLML